MPRHPEVIDDIVRRDEEFENTGRRRLGGSSYSSGVFREKATGRLWLGKSEVLGEIVYSTSGVPIGERISEERTEGVACREKIANDIYAYYGANVPCVQISRQRLSNTGDPEDSRKYAIHVMSELLDDFTTYKQAYGTDKFDAVHPNPNQSIVLADGRVLPERGLGSILAVAAFINDVDVIGGSGGNIGLQILRDDRLGEYARTVKIDPGAAFNNNPEIQVQGCTLILMSHHPSTLDMQVIEKTVFIYPNEHDANNWYYIIIKPNQSSKTGVLNSKAAQTITEAIAKKQANDSGRYLSAEESSKLQKELRINDMLYCKHTHVQGRPIRIALQAEPNCLKFDELPKGTQLEFLLTLHDIVRTNEATIRGFFTRCGGHNFILCGGKSDEQLTVERLTGLLLNRQAALSKTYAQDLAKTQADYDELCRQEELKQGLLEQARLTEASVVHEQLYFYIPPDVEENDVRQPLQTVFTEFLNPSNTAQVLLLKGDAGSGKTLSLLALEQQLLEAKRQDEAQPMVICSELKRFDKTIVTNCITTTVAEKYHLDLRKLSQQPVIILLDGYDEIAGTSQENIYRSHALHNWPHVKLIISCRTQYLTPGHEGWFMPFDNDGRPQNELLQIRSLALFTEQQIDAYLVRYCSQSNRPYTLEQYRQHIKEIPYLSQLITNPFMLRILVEALPELVSYYQSGGQVNKAALYSAFMRYWFVKQEKRLHHSMGLPGDWNAIEEFGNFSRSLAFTMHVQDCVEVQSQGEKAVIWERYLTNSDPDIVRARSGCPLQLLGIHRYSFVHKSFLEYFIASFIIHVLMHPETLAESGLQPKHIVKSAEVAEFLTDMVTDGEIKDRLWHYIEDSKTIPQAAPIAACAITLLNIIGVSFSGMNLQGIRIPGANLTGALLHYTNLRDADLSGATLCGAYLSYANLEHTNMCWIEFGECYSPLRHRAKVYCICFINDAELAVARGYGIIIWDYSIRSIRRVIGGKISIEKIVISPNKRLFASTGKEKTIRIWDVDTGKELLIYKGHTSYIDSIAFSANSTRLASVSTDKTIRVWSLNTGEELFRFETPEGAVNNVAFTSDDTRLVLVSAHKTVYVWSLDTKKEFSRYNDIASYVKFIPEGICFAYVVGDDEILYVLSVKNTEKKLLRCKRDESIFIHHLNVSTSAFSPDGKYLAIGDANGIVHIWSLITGEELFQFEGHEDAVNSIVFSPRGEYLVSSGGEDKTVRFWSTNIINQKFLQLTDNRRFRVSVDMIAPYSKKFVIDLNKRKLFAEGKILCPDTGAELCNLAKEMQEEYSLSNKNAVFDSDGTRLALHNCNYITKRIHIFSVETGKHLLRCGGGFKNAIFSPDNNYIAIGGENILIWSVNTGKLLLQLEGHQSYVNSIAFNVDGTRLVSGDEEGIIRVWSTDSGQKLLEFGKEKTFIKEKIFIISTAVNLEWSYIALGCTDGSVRIWSTINGQELLRYDGHTEAVNSVAFSPNSMYIASGSSDNTIRIWSVNTGEELLRCDGHTEAVNSVAFSPNSTRIASSSLDKTVRIWSVETGKELLRWSWSKEQVFIISKIAFSHDGRRLALGVMGKGKLIYILSVDTGEELLQCNVTDGYIWDIVIGLAFSPDSTRIISSTKNGVITINSTETGEKLSQWGKKRSVNTVTFSPDGTCVASGTKDGTIEIWSSNTGQNLLICGGYLRNVKSVSFSPDSTRIASGSSDKTVRVWSVETGKELLRCEGHEDGVDSVVFSLDSKKLISWSSDKTIRIWSIETGKELSRVECCEKDIQNVAFNKDGTRLALSAIGKFIILSVDTGKQLLKINTSDKFNFNKSLAFSLDGKYIVSVNSLESSNIQIYSVDSGERLFQYGEHIERIEKMIFSPDGKYIASIGYMAEDIIRLWSADTGQELLQFRGFRSFDIAFSPDGNYIASVGRDSEIHLLSINSGQEFLQYKGHTSTVISVSFSPNSKYICSGSRDKTLRIWCYKTGKCLQIIKVGNQINSLEFDGSNIIATMGMRILIFRLVNTYQGERYVLSCSIPRHNQLMCEGTLIQNKHGQREPYIQTSSNFFQPMGNNSDVDEQTTDRECIAPRVLRLYG